MKGTVLDFVQDEHHSILLSSHISTDIEKIADYITYIHEGSVIFSKSKDEDVYKRQGKYVIVSL